MHSIGSVYCQCSLSRLIPRMLTPSLTVTPSLYIYIVEYDLTFHVITNQPVILYVVCICESYHDVIVRMFVDDYLFDFICYPRRSASQ